MLGGSPAARAGIKPGWKLIKIDRLYIKDVLDYIIMTADKRFMMLFETDEGYLRRVKITTRPGEPLGIKFESPTLAPVQRCSNRCLFCFVDQNPLGMRQSLYLKDEDYRLSFLFGNYITLNRLSEGELRRITSLNLSPLYVSVHTTNPKLRQELFGNRHAGRGLSNLKKLVKAGIKVHTQIVLCPGLNTGAELKKTLYDLFSLGENILSVALVPVGLTAHRDSLPKIKGFDSKTAKKVIEFTEGMQEVYLKKRKSRFVFLADEFYQLAGLPYPGEEAYEGYPQLENGVGLVRLFLNELESIEEKLPPALERPLKVTMVTGVSACAMLKMLKKALSSVKGLQVNLVCAQNTHFGKSVTVSGLLTGRDILSALTRVKAGDLLFIPKTMLKDNSNLFLDNLAVRELEEKLKTKVKAVSGPEELLKEILKAGKPADQVRSKSDE